jgi:hypothetical protein
MFVPFLPVSVSYALAQRVYLLLCAFFARAAMFQCTLRSPFRKALFVIDNTTTLTPFSSYHSFIFSTISGFLPHFGFMERRHEPNIA